MAKKSLPDVSAKLVADVEGFIAGFRKAERQARGTASEVDTQLTKLANTVKKKFTTVDIGKGLLQGLGIGSGFAVAQTVADKITDYFADQAKYAEDQEKSTERQLQLQRELLSLYKTEDELLESTIADRNRAERAVVDALKLPNTLENKRKVLELKEAFGALAVEVSKMEVAAGSKRATENIALQEKLVEAEKRVAETVGKAQLATVSGPDAIIGLRKRVAELQYLTTDAKNLTSNASLENRVKMTQELADKQELLNKLTARASELGKQVGESVSNSFEEAIFSGNSLKDVLNSLIEDLLRLFVRDSLLKPLAGFVGTAFTNLFPARAEGGPVSGGRPYLVGEQGPELFMPGMSGTVIPNHALAGGGSRGGNVYQIDARGTDESVVQRLQQALFALAGPGVVERRALAAHVGTLRRGGGTARALGGA